MKLLLMSFDGDYKLERDSFKTKEQTWNYADSIGSRWFFYPFGFVVSDSGKTILDATDLLQWTIGKRVKTVAQIFNKHSQHPDVQAMCCDDFVLTI